MTEETKNNIDSDEFIPNGQFKDLLIRMKKEDKLGFTIGKKHYIVKRDE